MNTWSLQRQRGGVLEVDIIPEDHVSNDAITVGLDDQRPHKIKLPASRGKSLCCLPEEDIRPLAELFTCLQSDRNRRTLIGTIFPDRGQDQISDLASGVDQVHVGGEARLAGQLSRIGEGIGIPSSCVQAQHSVSIRQLNHFESYYTLPFDHLSFDAAA